MPSKFDSILGNVQDTQFGPESIRLHTLLKSFDGAKSDFTITCRALGGIHCNIVQVRFQNEFTYLVVTPHQKHSIMVSHLFEEIRKLVNLSEAYDYRNPIGCSNSRVFVLVADIQNDNSTVRISHYRAIEDVIPIAPLSDSRELVIVMGEKFPIKEVLPE